MTASVSTWNKGLAPLGSSGWQLTPDVRAGLESMNVVVPVATQAERDGLTPPLGTYVGMAVTRADLGGLIEVWNGSAWLSPVKRRHAEFTGNSDGTTTANAQWQFTPLTKDTAASTNDSFVSASASKSRITFNEPGVYSIHVKVACGTNPGVTYVAIKNSADTYVHADNTNGNGVVWGCTVPAPGVLIPNAGTDILFGLTTGTSITQDKCTVRILVTKLSD